MASRHSAKPVNLKNQKEPLAVKIPELFTKAAPPTKEVAKTSQGRTWAPPSPSIESPLKIPPNPTSTELPPCFGIEIKATKATYSPATWAPAKPIPVTEPVKIDTRFTTAGISEVEIQQNMIMLPPPADLSDIGKMKKETLDELMASEGKSQNQMVIDYQREVAIMLFKKDFTVSGKVYTIAEVEFYPEQDPYRPDDPAFSTSSTFYLKSSLLYITMGSPTNRCGILIRSIITAEGFIEGPEKVVEYINKHTRDNQLILGITDHVVPAEGCSSNPHIFDDTKIVYNGPRVGLNLCQETILYGSYCMFVMKPYRYTFCPGELKSAKHTLAVAARVNGVPDTIINRDFKLQAEMLGRWLGLFGRGESCYLEMFMDGKAKKLLDSSQQLLAYGFLNRFNK